MNLDLIEFYELRTHKQIVAELIKQYPNLPLPIPIDELAIAFGIIAVQEKNFNGMQGALVANAEKSKGIILVNSNITNLRRRRFTIGHEVGHFMLPNHGHNMRCSEGDMSPSSLEPIEREANAFASEILMPTQIFTKLRQFEDEPDLKNIITLAGMFDVSLQACGNKYTNLSAYPIATISTYQQKISSFWINKNELPFWLIPKKGDAVPMSSITRSAFTKDTGDIICDVVDSSIWFDETKGFELPEYVIEQTLVQENGYFYTLLWFEDEIIEVE